MSNRYRILISTDSGSVREANEDNFIFNGTIKRPGDEAQHFRARDTGEPILCAVFDGMGGEKGGKAASEIAARVALKFYEYLAEGNLRAADNIQDYVSNCNSQISLFMEKYKYKRSGCAFAMVYLHDGIAELFTMGDSRIYLYRRGCLIRVSRDHTLAQKKYEANIFTREEADESSESHILTRFLGMDEDSEDFCAEAYREVSLGKGDKLLICSDGLYNMCNDREIFEVLSVPEQPYTIQLVSKAKERGGEDNITCILIEPDKTAAQ